MSRPRMSLRLPPELRQRLEAVAEEQNVSLNSLVAAAVAAYLSAHSEETR